jgi:hypothetical protein
MDCVWELECALFQDKERLVLMRFWRMMLCSLGVVLGVVSGALCFRTRKLAGSPRFQQAETVIVQ